MLGSISSRVRRVARYHPRTEIEVEVARFGTDYGGWDICPSLLGPGSVVYSLGVGEDVSFDLALIAELGVQVFAFDPTPKAVRWIDEHDVPGQLAFFPLGVAAHDGVARFTPPLNPDYASYRIDDTPGEEAITLPVRRLGTIMSDLGHTRLDLVKMDIEGAEFAVVRDMLSSRIEVDQLVVEVHPPQGRVFGPIWRLVRSLRRGGFRLFWVSDRLCELSFLHARCGDAALR
jgi:FkbM family methyltransferase